MKKNSVAITVLLSLLFGVCLIIAILPYFMSQNSFVLEFSYQFKIFITAGLLLPAIVFALCKRRVLALLQLMLCAVAFYPVYDFYTIGAQAQSCAATEKPDRLRVLSFNVYHKNTEPDEVDEGLLKYDADVIVMYEVKRDFARKIHTTLAQEYKYSYPILPNGRLRSWIVYSRFPIENADAVFLPNNRRQRALFAQIIYNENKKIDIHAHHATSPKNEKRIGHRNEYFVNMNELIQNTPKTTPYVIVMGDFNTAPWHPLIRDMLRDHGLSGNNAPLNYFGTWPTWAPSALTIPIDHIFHSGRIKAENYHRAEAMGSDHFPVYADFILCD